MTDSQAFAAFETALAGRYRIERELGRGGMATVFRARDVRHSRDVAIKVLRPDVAAALGAERFAREIETVAGLSHPHILPLHDSGAAGSQVYYVMPFVDGETLRARLERERQLPVQATLGIAREVADALAHAHRNGIVHRDIKPENVLLQGSHALVADFGIALAVQRAGDERMTQTGLSVGTPAYMSPEQATGERDIDGRSDIYSLGCVLYEMLAGEPPFTGPTAQAVITRRMTGPPPRVRRLRPNISETLDAVVARAMAPLAADRFQTADDFLEALTYAASHADGLPTRPSKGRIVAAVGGVVALMTVLAAAFLWRARPALPPSASAIVVLPPMPVSADTSLARLGRELAITVSASLDGVGGIHVADALGVLANVDASAPALSLEQARALAQRFGARSVVRGTLIRVGDSVRVDVALHPTACTSGECTEPLSRALASAPVHDIARLTDETTWALLRGVWQREGAPTPSLTAVTTRSIPALRAFLEGERAIVEGRWRAAPAAYERAFTDDSTFLLAYWRYALAKSYWHEPVDPGIRAKYRENRGRFPPRDRMLIEAELADSMSVRYDRTKAAAERFPDYWPAWWTLSERLAHETPLIGTTSRDLRAALEHTLALNPRMTSGWDHLFWLSTWERDTALARRVLQQLTLLRWDTVSMQEVGFDELAHYRYIADGITGDGTPRDTVVRQFGAGILAAMPASTDPMMLGLGITQYSLGREQVAMSARVLARHPAPAVAAGHYLAAAVAQASRGAWDSSLVALDGYIARVTDPAAPLYAYRMAVVGAWLGALTPDAAVARRGAAVRDSVSLPAARRAELAWLDGILAVTSRDADALASARRALRGADSVSAPMLERSLAAFANALSGERDRAADSLVALERERAERGLSRRASDAHPFLTAVDRLAAARWLQERGKSGDAARLLSWFEAVLVPMRATRQANATVEGLAYLERARVAESLGSADVAREYYRRFLVRYDAPMPLHRHLVEEANQALIRLGAATADAPRR